MKKIIIFASLIVSAISFGQNCNSLEIVTVNNTSICGPGSATLSVTSSGIGNDIYWYDNQVGNNIIHTGATFKTPNINFTTSYWAAESLYNMVNEMVGPINPNIGTSTTSSAPITSQRLYFDVIAPVTLESVDIFPTTAIGSQGSVTIRDNNQNIMYDVPYTTSVTGGNTPQTITINAVLTPGTGYEMGQGTAIGLTANTTGAVYPYTSSAINITGNNSNQTAYSWYYNWKLGGVACESSRKEVIATVNNTPDINITTLPYTHTANTATYHNNYSGAPGTNCGTTAAYLYGNDVVYGYTANGNYNLNVELSGLNQGFSGVFVYNSCYDIGNTCATQGSVNVNTGNHSFNMTVQNGSTYYFVVSSAAPTSSFGYTLSIQAVTDYIYDSGTWTPTDPSGISTFADNITVMNGTTSLTANSDVNNLTVNAGATLNIQNVLNLKGDIINNGDLIFKSTATSNGELGPVLGTSAIIGNVTVERYMSSNRSYRLVSSAVTTTSSIHDNWQEGATSNTHNPNPTFGTHITGSTIDQQNGFDGTSTGTPGLFEFDIPTQQFVSVQNTDVNTLSAGEPYRLFVRGSRSINLSNNNDVGETVLRATGTLFTGSQTQTFLPAAAANNFVMFGNPYQSAVDISSVFGNTNTININTNQYYIYDPTLATNGAYVTIDLINGTNTGGFANKYLQPGQGAQAVTMAAGTTSIMFSEADKAPGAGNFTSTNRPISVQDMLTIQLYTTQNFYNGGPLHDSFRIIFGNGLDNALTPMDAVKPMNFYENLSIDHNGTYLSLERREMPQLTEVYNLYISGYTESDYILNMTVEGLDGTFLYLDDHYSGSSTLLKAGDNTYSFNVDAANALSIATDRFSIRTAERLSVNDNNLLAGIRLYPNPLNTDVFYINAPRLNGEQLSVSISDLSGRRIFDRTLECRANTVTVPMGDNIASGVYLVTLQQEGEVHAYRLIKE